MEEPLSLVLGEGSWASRLIAALKYTVCGVYIFKHSFYDQFLVLLMKYITVFKIHSARWPPNRRIALVVLSV